MLSDKIIENVIKKNNPSVIGLDTKFEYLPTALQKKYLNQYGETLKAASKAILEYNKTLIDAVYDIVAVVKVQVAYYEMYGVEGMITFSKTCSYAKKKGLFVIADCKRNDIGSTAAAYSAAYLGKTKVGNCQLRAFESDCVTVNPYLGTDGIKPFIDDCDKNDKGIFILVKTSNPSSVEYQDKIFTETGNTLYNEVAKNINNYIIETGKYGFSNLGVVVGATYPEVAKELRSKLDKCLILVPGYGAQGADARFISNFFNKDGLGALVNSSRAILLAYKNKGTDDYAFAAREKTLDMKDDLNRNK